MQNLPAIVAKPDGTYPIAIIETADGDMRKLPPKGTLLRTQAELSMIAMEKKDLSERERNEFKAYAAEGGSPKVLKFLRMLGKMDPDDRREYVDELLAMLIELKYTSD